MLGLLNRFSLLLTAVVLFCGSLQLLNRSIVVGPGVVVGHVSGWLNSATMPLTTMVHSGVKDIGASWSRYRELLDVEAQRDDLAARVRTLEEYNSRLVEYRNENERLRRLAGFEARGAMKSLGASVVGRDPSAWFQAVVINKGAEAGVRPGLAVVDGQGLVGQVVDAWEGGAKVLLISDLSSAVAVLLQDARVPGIVEGDAKFGELSMQLRYVPSDVTVTPGEKIVTSGLDAVFPKGLVVGIVSRVVATGQGMFQSVTVTPRADLYRLEDVLVLFPEHVPSPQAVAGVALAPAGAPPALAVTGGAPSLAGAGAAPPVSTAPASAGPVSTVPVSTAPAEPVSKGPVSKGPAPKGPVSPAAKAPAAKGPATPGVVSTAPDATGAASRKPNSKGPVHVDSVPVPVSAEAGAPEEDVTKQDAEGAPVKESAAGSQTHEVNKHR